MLTAVRELSIGCGQTWIIFSLVARSGQRVGYLSTSSRVIVLRSDMNSGLSASSASSFSSSLARADERTVDGR